MLNLTDSQKESFYKSGAYFNDYEFDFPDLDYTITNETLHQESVIIKESICDSEDLQLGGCIASSCEFEVSELENNQLAGVEFTAKLLVNDGKDAVVPMGKYRVDSAKRVNDKDYRKIVAYDALYDAQIDVSDWYNKVFYVVSEYEEVVAVGDIDDLWEHGDYYIDNSGSKPPWIAFFANGAVPEEAHDTTYLDTSTGKLYEAQDTSKDEDNELYRWVEVYQCKRKTTTKRIYAKTTLKKLRESLLNYLNISFIEQDLINDDVTIERTFDTSDTGEIIGTDILKYICELNAGFGKINRDGKFEVVQLTSAGLYPEETLYPSEDLYPEESNYELLSAEENEANYISVAYEEYETEAITGVIVKSNSDNVGQVVGTKDNAYMLTGNPLIYNKTSEDLTKIGQNIFAKIKGITYRPNTTTLEGLPYLETGDYYILTKNNDDVGSPIFTRTLAGVQALKDTFESKGNKLRVNEDSQTSEMMTLQSKMLKIQKGVDGLLIEVTDLDENTSSRFEQTASKIEAEVTRASNAEGELSGRITVTADQITQEVTRAKAEEATLSGRITVTAGEITQEVTRATSEENTLRASISLKIDKDDDGQIISMINESADVITLNSNRLVIDSTNFSLDRSGNVSMKGKVEATSGSIGWFDITSRGLEWASGTGTRIWSNVIFTDFIEAQGASKRLVIGAETSTNRGKVDINSSDGGVWINNAYFNPRDAIDLNSSKINVTYSSSGNVKIENCQGFISEGTSGYGNLATVGYVKSKVSSDERIKKNIVDIPNVKDVYMDIPVYQFEYNSILERDGICFGTTAQGIERAFKKHKLDIDKYNIVQKRQPSVFNGEYKYIPTVVFVLFILCLPKCCTPPNPCPAVITAW
jgi:hypothetical protein